MAKDEQNRMKKSVTQHRPNLAAPTETGDVAPLTRAMVSAAVDEYGLAWVNQDPSRIACLFTQDAVYVERCFDPNGTFRGRDAIRAYWETQIVGKQSNIQFRHVEEELVLDTEKRCAVVKWLAVFDNFREKRGSKGEKTVRFCQVAKLVFSADGRSITYLEEYATPMGSKPYWWPPLDASSCRLLDMVRMEPDAFTPPSSGKEIPCEHCGELFASKNKLFKHIRAGTCGVEQIDEQENSAALQKIVFGVCYTAAVAEGQEEAGEGCLAKIGNALSQEIEEACKAALGYRCETPPPGATGEGKEAGGSPDTVYSGTRFGKTNVMTWWAVRPNPSPHF